MSSSPPFFINPALEVVDVDGSTLSVLSPFGRFSIRDASGLARDLVAAARDGLDLETFALAHGERHERSRVEETARDLIGRRVLLPQGEEPVDSLLSFGDYAAQAAAEPWRIELAGEGELAGHVAGALRRLGFAAGPFVPGDLARSPARTLVAACSDREDFGFFRAVNREAVACGRPAYYLSIDRHLVRAGPLVVPGATACVECLFLRVSSTRLFRDEFLARNEPGRRLAAPRPSVIALQFAAAALAWLVPFLRDRPCDAHLGPLREYDILRGSLRASNLLRLPRCPVCGGARERPVPAVFQAAAVRRGG